MELQIQDLISSIKKEGIESANRQAADILAEARRQAETIVSDARAEADGLLDSARAEAEVFRSSARLSAEQAKRDALLAFRQEVQAQLGEILSARVRDSLNAETLARLLVAAVGDEDPAGYVMEVQEVSDALRQALAEKVRAGLELRASRRAQGGFRLTEKDGSGYLDCSDEELARLLSPFFREMRL